LFRRIHSLLVQSKARVNRVGTGREAWLDGFTVSEFYPAMLFAAALVDQTQKDGKRSPENARCPEGARGPSLTQVTSFTPLDLPSEALRAASLWRFSPSMRMAQPVPALISMELVFSIH
jgi:hypothetical protein